MGHSEAEPTAVVPFTCEYFVPITSNFLLFSIEYTPLVLGVLVKSVFLRSANTGSGGGGCVSEDVALL